jgi:uncharacterized protein with HEPN domain
MKREYDDYLQDMLSNAKRAIQFAEGADFDAFMKDEKSVYAVIRAIEIIGEASQKIPSEVRDKHPEIPWREISTMRNKLIHEYFGSTCKLFGRPFARICQC